MWYVSPLLWHCKIVGLWLVKQQLSNPIWWAALMNPMPKGMGLLSCCWIIISPNKRNIEQTRRLDEDHAGWHPNSKPSYQSIIWSCPSKPTNWSIALKTYQRAVAKSKLSNIAPPRPAPSIVRPTPSTHLSQDQSWWISLIVGKEQSWETEPAMGEKNIC